MTAATDTGYNGWTNYETWNTHLWITNEPGPYEAARELVASALTFNEARFQTEYPTWPPDEIRTLAISYAADELREWWDEANAPTDEGNGHGPIADAWTHHIDAANWREIAEALAEV